MDNPGRPYGRTSADWVAKNSPSVYADLCWLRAESPGMAKRPLDELVEVVPTGTVGARQ
jgi:hypothetical protein